MRPSNGTTVSLPWLSSLLNEGDGVPVPAVGSGVLAVLFAFPSLWALLRGPLVRRATVSLGVLPAESIWPRSLAGVKVHEDARFFLWQ
jgi:hypothetical protein